MTKLWLNNEDYKDTPDRHLIELLGILPTWVKEWVIFGSDIDIVKYMTDAYECGSLYRFKGEILEDGSYRSCYDTDPDMPWIGKMNTPNGTAYFYDSAILALPMPDGKHYITRMD